MEILDGPEGEDGPVQYLSFCPRHATPRPHMSGAPLGREHAQETGILKECGWASVPLSVFMACLLPPLPPACRLPPGQRERGARRPA